MAAPLSPYTLPHLAQMFIVGKVFRTPKPSQHIKSDPEFLHLLHVYHNAHGSLCGTEQPPACSLWQACCHGLRRMRKMAFYWAFQICFRLFYLVVACLKCEPDYFTDNDKAISWMIPCATKLKEAGVRFKRKDREDEEPGCMLNVTFSDDGVLEIPFMKLHGGSASHLRNLIAFEQCCFHHGVGDHITSYCHLMANLIGTENDVDILQEQGIIFHSLGSRSSVSLFFNQITQGVELDLSDHHFSGLFVKVNEYSKFPMNRWRARLMRDYFGNPWAIISVLAAAVVIALTIVQATYAILRYYHRP